MSIFCIICAIFAIGTMIKQDQSNQTKATKIRYFEYGVSFHLKSGCASGAQATVSVDHQLSFDEIKNNTQKWIGKDSIIKFNVWYLSEITEGEMYAVQSPYNCSGKDIDIFNRLGKIRILNQKTK